MLTILERNSGRWGGRQKGTQNKINADIRAMILEALDDAGGVDYLSKQARANPVAFMGLLGKILPTAVSNADGSPIALHLLAASMFSEQLAQERTAPPTIEAQQTINMDDIPTE